MAEYADVAKKTDAEMAELEKDAKVLDALEADLQAAQAAVDSAEARYNQVSRWVAKEMAKPEADEAAEPQATAVYTQEKEVDADDQIAMSAEQAREPASRGEKNASARTEKEVKRSKWEANHAQEARVRSAAKKSREKLRRGQRDSKYARAEVEGAEADQPTEGGTPAATPEKKAVDQRDAAAINDGARSIAERTKHLKDLPSAADKHDSLLKVMMGNKEGYFSTDPAEVVLDLKERGLVDSALASELMAILNDIAPVKGPALSPDQWLEQAKKVASLERPDEQPITANEFAYLRSIDWKHLKDVEAELASAEAHLKQLVQLSDTWYPSAESAESKPAPAPVIAEVKVDVDEAAVLEEKNEKKSESRGSKNTSALSSKVVSKEKWLDDRGYEHRERESKIKARQARRAECQDLKMRSAEVDA